MIKQKATTGNLLAIHPGGYKEILKHDMAFPLLLIEKAKILAQCKAENIKLIVTYAYKTTN
jgi:hypothetical protein